MIEHEEDINYENDINDISDYPLWQLGCDECELYNTSACYSCVYYVGE